MTVPNARVASTLARHARATQDARRFIDRSSSTVHHVTGELEHHIAKGGIYNVTTLAGALNAAHGMARSDAADAARELRKIGFHVTIDEAEAYLLAAIRGEITVKDNTAAARKRRQREKARAERKCLTNPAHGYPGDDRVVCPACQLAAEMFQAQRKAPVVTDTDLPDLPDMPF